MPIMDIKVKTGSKGCRARCLLDSDSQRSHLSEKVCAVLACNDENVSIIQHDIKTFLGSQKKELKEIHVAVEIPNLKPFNQKVLIDKEFHIQLNMPQYVEVISNLACKGVPLAVQYEGGLPLEIVEIDGLMGVDVLQNLSMTRTVVCMKGIAWEFPNGLVPYGDANNFLFPRQISVLPSLSSSRPDTFNNYNHIISRYAKCPETHVNFVMNPKSSYPDPLQRLFPESSVGRNLDMMFQTEGLGIDSKENAITDYDSVKIKDFEDSIEFEDGHYNVKLPWHEDVLEKVPSNHNVALTVMDRVSKKLEKDNLMNDYIKVFKQQEEEGIIERIEVDPQKYADCTWIPHRPIIKTEQQVASKIRPVFNCSLKTHNSPSLNEAAYPGVNLMTDMTKLLLYFRCNKVTMISDIRKAFLMIKLDHEEDKNRFCFFIKDGNKLSCFRYKTIIFGYNASPLILNFIIKHHAKQFPSDNCSEVLLNNFYVDNLMLTAIEQE